MPATEVGITLVCTHMYKKKGACIHVKGTSTVVDGIKAGETCDQVSLLDRSLGALRGWMETS